MPKAKKLTRNAPHVKLFSNTVHQQLEVQRKQLLRLKEVMKSDVEQRCEKLKAQIPTQMLHMTFHDLRLLEESCSNEKKDKNNINIQMEVGKFTIPKFAPQLPGYSAKNYVTPHYSKAIPRHVITPKVGPDSPATVLRIPGRDEYAVSAAGSPLQVNCFTGKTASVTIPLNNGKVMNILPAPNVNTEPIERNIDPTVKKQLENLQSVIYKILHGSETTSN